MVTYRAKQTEKKLNHPSYFSTDESHAVAEAADGNDSEAEVFREERVGRFEPVSLDEFASVFEGAGACIH